MFTGLVETKGAIVRVLPFGREARFVVRGRFERERLTLGESIAVDGVCLTVANLIEAGPGLCVFEADVSSETLQRTTLGHLASGSDVNLERALPLGGRVGGHLVSGHVDGVGHLIEKVPMGGAIKLSFAMPPELARFVAKKGSICVSGISLTVNHVSSDSFDIVLVPHTREKTSLDVLPVGARVNLEVDVLARYIERLLETGHATSPSGPSTSRSGVLNALSRDAMSASSANSDAAWTDRLARAGYL